jgi:hypothetical protein
MAYFGYTPVATSFIQELTLVWRQKVCGKLISKAINHVFFICLYIDGA